MDKNNYHPQNGCWNCKHEFVWEDYDSPYEFFCNIDNDRPKCGSSLIEETFNFEVEENNMISNPLMGGDADYPDSVQWDIWADKHSVREAGICDKWEEKK